MLCHALKLRKKARYIKCSDNSFRDIKHRIYKWGTNQCMKRLLKDPAKNLLEVIINSCNIKLYTQVSIQALLTTYNRKHPNHPISRATLYRYLNVLIKQKLIKRFDQLEFNKTVITRLLAPKLVVPSVSKRDTNNLSLDKLHQSVLPPLGAGTPLSAFEQSEACKIALSGPTPSFADIRRLLQGTKK